MRHRLPGLAHLLPPAAPRILPSTRKLVGEGFDHSPLDTLVLAMPVSRKGTLQQYAGRLHREHASKADVRIIDFVDTGHPAPLRMWGQAAAGLSRDGVSHGRRNQWRRGRVAKVMRPRAETITA